MMNIGTICIQLIKLQMVEEICCRFKHELDHKQTLARGEQSTLFTSVAEI